MRYPTSKPTPSEYAVLAVLASVVFIVLGVVALVVAFRAPDDKQELAATVMRGGFVSLGIGLTIAFLFWLHRRLTG